MTKYRKMGCLGAVLGLLGPSWGRLGAVLQPSGAGLTPSWAFLGPPQVHLGSSWCDLGSSWGCLGPSWAVLGRFGPSWGRLGAFWGSTILAKTMFFPKTPRVEGSLLGFFYYPDSSLPCRAPGRGPKSRPATRRPFSGKFLPAPKQTLYWPG